MRKNKKDNSGDSSRLRNPDKSLLLWGKHAQEKAHIINKSNNKVFMSSHPSPYSANQGFFGSKPFSKTNDYLTSTKQTTINW